MTSSTRFKVYPGGRESSSPGQVPPKPPGGIPELGAAPGWAKRAREVPYGGGV